MQRSATMTIVMHLHNSLPPLALGLMPSRDVPVAACITAIHATA